MNQFSGQCSHFMSPENIGQKWADVIILSKLINKDPTGCDVIIVNS